MCDEVNLNNYIFTNGLMHGFSSIKFINFFAVQTLEKILVFLKTR